jgi:hypothetical protein
LPNVKTVTTFHKEQIALCVLYLEGKALKFSRRILYTTRGSRKTEIATFEQFWDLLREEFKDPKLVYRNTHLLRELGNRICLKTTSIVFQSWSTR